MKKIFVSAFLALTVCMLLTGCQEANWPEGLAKPYPTILTLTQQGKPLADAEVILISRDPGLNRFAMGGITDQNGVVDAYTNGIYRGVPAGDYSVVVNKISVVSKESSPTESTDSMEINPFYGNVSTTPLKINVKKKKNHFQLEIIDLSKKTGEPQTK